MTFEEYAKNSLTRCTCQAVDDEPVPDVPGQYRCKSCKGWTVLAITTSEEYAAFKKWAAA